MTDHDILVDALRPLAECLQAGIILEIRPGSLHAQAILQAWELLQEVRNND